TVILPVGVPGAGLYLGDCKAAMGDREVVCAPEIGARIVARAKPIRRPESMRAPRLLTADPLITVVSGISLGDACRAAFAQLKPWVQDEGELPSDQAAVVRGIGAHCGIAQVSTPLHTAKCSISRSLCSQVTRERGYGDRGPAADRLANGSSRRENG